MMDAMPKRVLWRWMAYERMEPFGHPIDDLRFARLMQATVGGKSKVSDFQYKPPHWARQYLKPAEIRAMNDAAERQNAKHNP